MDWENPSDDPTGFLDSCPFGEQLEGVLWSVCLGRLLTRDPDCPTTQRKILLPWLHSLLPVTWEPATDELVLSLVSWGDTALSLGTVVVPNSSCRQDAKHIPSTCSSREASLGKFGVRNNYFHFSSP